MPFELDAHEYFLIDRHPTRFQRKKGRNQSIDFKYKPIKIKEQLKIIQEFRNPYYKEKPNFKYQPLVKKPIPESKINKKIVGQV
jgi:hypothetical protein